MMCTDGKTVIFKCFIIFTNHQYTFIGLYDTRCKNAEMFFFCFFSGFLAFYSSDWRVRGKRFIKCWLGFKPTLYFSHKKQDFLKVFLHRSFSTLIQFSSCTMGNVIMPHLNLITPQLWSTVRQMNHLLICTNIIGILKLLPMEGQEGKRRSSCLVKQNIHEKHIRTCP